MNQQGRPPVVALDIGGTKLAAAVVTEDGKTHAFSVEPTRRADGPAVILRRLFDMGHHAVAASGLDRIGAVGISCGGPLDSTTGVLLAPLHLPGWTDVPIADLAATDFGVPAVLENDATAAALGEYRYGAGRGTSDMVYLTISTGIGGGAIIDGRLHRGAAGNGGEFGHIVVESGGRPCLCGRSGCLEVYASGTSIAQRAREAVVGRPDSSLSAVDTILAEDVVAAMRSGDPLATSIWAETTDLIGVAVTDLVNILEPELVVLGGGVSRAGESLIGPVREAVARDAMKPAAAAVRLELAALGDQSPTIGAAAVAFDRVPTTATNDGPTTDSSATDRSAPGNSTTNRERLRA